MHRRALLRWALDHPGQCPAAAASACLCCQHPGPRGMCCFLRGSMGSSNAQGRWQQPAQAQRHRLRGTEAARCSDNASSQGPPTPRHDAQRATCGDVHTVHCTASSRLAAVYSSSSLLRWRDTAVVASTLCAPVCSLVSVALLPPLPRPLLPLRAPYIFSTAAANYVHVYVSAMSLVMMVSAQCPVPSGQCPVAKHLITAVWWGTAVRQLPAMQSV